MNTRISWTSIVVLLQETRFDNCIQWLKEEKEKEKEKEKDNASKCFLEATRRAFILRTPTNTRISWTNIVVLCLAEKKKRNSNGG